MIVAIDLETTWLDTLHDRILEVALVKIDEKDFSIVEEYTTLVDPESEIPELITQITGISEWDIVDKPIWSEIIDKVSDFIWDAPVLWHNVSFDTWFLKNNGVSLLNNISIDTFDYVNFLCWKEKSLNLEYLCDVLWFSFDWAHRALSDTKATIELFKYIIKRLRGLSLLERKYFEYTALRSEEKSFLYVYEKILGRSPKHQDSDSFLHVFLKDVKSKQVKLLKNVDYDIADIWLKDFINKNDDLELRENQEKMSQIVLDWLEQNKKNIIEAPTGIWKTFAYLLPSIFFSIKTWEQVHISTSTKALQDQIVYKDLAYIKDNLGIDFSYSKLKGRKNYLSIVWFLNFFMVKDIAFSKQESSFIIKMLFWLIETKWWELDELDYYWKEFYFLSEISSDDWFTLSKDNPYKKYEFVLWARANAKKSNIVIINNSILFQDIEWDNALLWWVENLVLDEAHNLEDVVTQAYKKWFYLDDIEKHFTSVEKILRKYKIYPQEFPHKFEKILFDFGGLFDYFESYLFSQTWRDQTYKNILLWSWFFDKNQDIEDMLKIKQSIFIGVTEILDEMMTFSDEIYMLLQREIDFFESVIKILDIILDKQDTKYIKMLFYNHRKQSVWVEYTLLNVWEYLEKNLWSKLNSCIVTSATLCIDLDFSYIRNILHLHDFEECLLESDFDYSKQMLIYIPNDLGNIKKNTDEVSEFLLKFFTIVRGRTLLLFTSYYLIKEVYKNISHVLKSDWVNAFAQWIGWWKHKLVESFKKNAENSVLLWTDSFWEWVDIPGWNLQYLFIHKAPFNPPNDPIFQARSALFQNSFMQYAVPKCIIKLKQWFGRLIRTKHDTGVVIFLDDRIHSTKWWEVLYESFPHNAKVRVASSNSFFQVLSQQKKG